MHTESRPRLGRIIGIHVVSIAACWVIVMLVGSRPGSWALIPLSSLQTAQLCLIGIWLGFSSFSLFSRLALLVPASLYLFVWQTAFIPFRVSEIVPRLLLLFFTYAMIGLSSVIAIGVVSQWRGWRIRDCSTLAGDESTTRIQFSILQIMLFTLLVALLGMAVRMLSEVNTGGPMQWVLHRWWMSIAANSIMGAIYLSLMSGGAILATLGRRAGLLRFAGVVMAAVAYLVLLQLLFARTMGFTGSSVVRITATLIVIYFTLLAVRRQGFRLIRSKSSAYQPEPEAVALDQV